MDELSYCGRLFGSKTLWSVLGHRLMDDISKLFDRKITDERLLVMLRATLSDFSVARSALGFID